MWGHQKIKAKCGGRERAYLIKVLTTELYDLSSVPENYMMEA